VALDIRDQSEDIWIWDLERETLTKLTNVSANTWPIWTPDGTHIVFTSARTDTGKTCSGSGRITPEWPNVSRRASAHSTPRRSRRTGKHSWSRHMAATSSI